MRVTTVEATEDVDPQGRRVATCASVREHHVRARQPWLTDIGDHRRSGVAEPVEVPPLPDREPQRESDPVGAPGEDR